MILDEAYEHLKQHGLTDSHVDFSTRWLNKSARYMSMLRATGREPSLDTLVRLLANLKLHYDAFSQSQVNVIRVRADWVQPVLSKANKELLKRAQR